MRGGGGVGLIDQQVGGMNIRMRMRVRIYVVGSMIIDQFHIFTAALGLLAFLSALAA